ncbi:deoxyribodipyrimidine photo-lyase [Vibrio sp. TRT 17S01]|uniref:deoxyribodipyrimidine photo-lyase n=1 Tax=Vibrio sp. TRT 17S01 TaxID=3418505 RepID=UPI003CF7978A
MKLVWFRRDLRVDDNRALFEAIKSGEPVIGVYVATPDTWLKHHLAPIQADLIYRRLEVLKQELAQYNVELIYHESDTYEHGAEFVAHIAKQCGAGAVYLNKDYEVDEQRRDEHLRMRLKLEGVAYQCFDDKCIFPPGSVLNKQGEYFKVFTPFKKAYLSKLYALSFSVLKTETASPLSQLQKDKINSLQLNASFSFPRVSSAAYPIDRIAIRNQLRDFDQQWVEHYHQQRDFPALLATSRLSPYLAIGALSVRQCMGRVMYRQTPTLSCGREVWQSELIWREFYQHLLHFEPKLSKGRCFLEWGESLQWVTNDTLFQAWKEGMTGYPIVDAAMRQLNTTGWMHNRLRMIVASFLVKDLHISWREGEAYFMSHLIDGDYAANNGGWQWCASTGCDGQPYFRIFNPITQGEKFDPDGVFIRCWVPELRDLETRYIHQPWKCPAVNTLSYPKPIVDHKVEREITLRLYKEAKET